MSKNYKNFIEKVMPELDEPEAFLPAINQYITKEEDWGEDKTRTCLVVPVPQSASIQNLGIAILSNIINEQMGDDFISTRAYHPEPKLLKRMKKENVEFFDSCIYHPVKDYDFIGFSSFYSLQYLSFIPLLNLSGIPYKAEDRLDSWDYPVVGLGGIQSYSAEPVSPIFDAFFIGEGEEMVPAFLELMRKFKKAGKTKREFLLEASRTIQGILLPWCYEVEYYSPDDASKPNQIKEIKLTEEGKRENIPSKVLKACIEFRDTKPLTKLFVPSGEGAEMSVSSLYLCNSCSNGCSFCQGSAISLPLRERPYDFAKQAADEIINNVGSKEIVPYCFNVSDLSYVNRLSKYILLEKNKKVSFSSERLDSLDDRFVKTSIKSGSRSFTVAVEAASARGRKILNKHLTEEQILNAFEILFRNGAQKIKVYNIASWPFEQEEDRLYYASLMEKIEELKKKHNAKTQIRLSFTPLTIAA